MKRSLQVNPLNKPATWADIKSKREELKRIPIATSIGAIDVDDVSFLNITTAISSFSAISDPQTNTITWKLADNSFVNVTQAELQEVVTAVAVRANTIHTKAEEINATGGYLVGELNDLAVWGIAE